MIAPRSRELKRIAVAAVVLAFVAAEGARPFVRHGDATEYIVTTGAWLDHASPDIRKGDMERMRRLPGDDLQGPITVQARDGATLTLHFWLYPLVCAPAMALLRLVHANELRAFALTNALLFALATCVAWSSGNLVHWRRRIFTVLAAVGPALWYLRWSSPETMCWACVVVALALLDSKRYAPAATFAALASLHNPPIALLAVAIVVSSLSSRRPLTFALTVAASTLSLLAPLYYVLAIGALNPIVMNDATDVSLISFARTASVLFDANQGLLPYAPLLVIGLPVAVFRGVRKSDIATIAVSIALVGMILTVQPQKNWNAGCAGIMRYGVWMLPVFAWLIAREVPLRRDVVIASYVELSWQIATVLVHFSADEDYLEHRHLARLLLDYAPSFYNPDPEIFVERTIHTEVKPPDYPGVIPIAYERADGEVTKLIVTPEAFGLIRRRFELAPGYRPILARRAGDGPLATYHYIDPPKGVVRRSYPPMRVGYSGCDVLAPERNGRWCEADSRITVHNLEGGAGHVKLEATFERPSNPCELDIDVSGRRDHVTVARANTAARYSTTLIVPGGGDVTIRVASTDPADGPNGTHHLVRDVAIVRADAP